MKYLFQLLLITSTSKVFVLLTENDEKRFIALSGYDTAIKFYPRIIRNRRNDGTPPPNEHTDIDIDTKKRICDDITSDYTFRQRGEYPYGEGADCFCRWVFPFKYPTETIHIHMWIRTQERPTESVFACPVRNGCWNAKYYISTEYKLDPYESEADEACNVGRFIFTKFRDTAYIWGLAELPASTFISPDLNPEHLYLQKRRKYSRSRERENDALCKLEEEDRKIICVAAFNSKYFDEKIVFSHGNKIASHCVLETVSFQTDYGKKEAGIRKFKEWMLMCESRSDPNEENRISYLISHAYHPNQIFVYFREDNTSDVFIESLSINVRLTVNYSSLTYRDSDDEEIPISSLPATDVTRVFESII